MTQQEYLDRIAAKCRELLAIAEKRTPGEWGRVDRTVFALTPYVGDSEYFKRKLPDGINRFSCYVNRDNSQQSGGAGDVELTANAQFIAACAGPAEAGWRATIAAIEALTKIAKPAFGGKFQQYEAQDAIDAIIAAWPENLL